MTSTTEAGTVTSDRASARSTDGFGSAVAIVVVAWGLLALSRLGGSVTQAGRPFVRFVVIGIWCWLLASAVLWGATRALRHAGLDARTALVATGRAHGALIGWAVVLFVAAGALQLRWPGLVAGLVVTLWMPWSMAMQLHDRVGGTGRAAAASSIAHLAWLATAGRFLVDRLGHLI